MLHLSEAAVISLATIIRSDTIKFLQFCILTVPVENRDPTETRNNTYSNQRPKIDYAKDIWNPYTFKVNAVVGKHAKLESEYGRWMPQTGETEEGKLQIPFCRWIGAFTARCWHCCNRAKLRKTHCRFLPFWNLVGEQSLNLLWCSRSL